MRPTIGQLYTYRGIRCSIVNVHASGTLDVLSLDGMRAWRLTGMWF